MAGKNQVLLTFAGDAGNLDKTFDQVGASSKNVEKKLDGVGASIDRLGDSASRSQGGTEKFGGGLDRTADSADAAETRMTGLASGIDGVTTLMDNPSPQEFAQGLADMADGAGNFLMPTLKRAGEAVVGFGKRITGASTGMGALGKSAVGAAGVAGVGALIFGIHQMNEQLRDARIQDLADDFIKVGHAGEEMKRALDTKSYMSDLSNTMKVVEGGAHQMDDFQGTLSKLIEESPKVARAYVDQAEAAGLDKDAVMAARLEISHHVQEQNRVAAATGEATEATRAQQQSMEDLAEANMALFDPIFGVINANQGLRDSQNSVVEAIDQFGAHSQEARDAQLRVIESTVGQDAAVRKLAAGVRSGSINMGQAVGRLKEMGGSSANTAALVNILEQEVYGLRGQIAGLRDKTVNINVQYRQSGRTNVELLAGYASGGVVPEYLASGGFGFTPRGTDTVPAMLTPGEMVLNDSQQSHLWAMANGRGAAGGGGGNTYVTVNVAGSIRSDRDLVQMMHTEIRRLGFGGGR